MRPSERGSEIPPPASAVAGPGNSRRLGSVSTSPRTRLRETGSRLIGRREVVDARRERPMGDGGGSGLDATPPDCVCLGISDRLPVRAREAAGSTYDPYHDGSRGDLGMASCGRRCMLMKLLAAFWMETGPDTRLLLGGAVRGASSAALSLVKVICADSSAAPGATIDEAPSWRRSQSDSLVPNG